MKKLFYLLLLLPLLVVNSCKKDTGDDDGGDGLSSITLTVLEDNKIAGIESFVFRVRGNDGITYTSQCDIFVDGQEINNNYHVPTHSGTTEVYAVKGNLTSPTITVNATTIDLAVTANPTSTYIEMEAFEFTATGSNGTDYTSISTFFVNDVEIDDDEFDPELAGDYEVYAVIGDNAIISLTITVTATVGFTSLDVSTDRAGYLVGETAVFNAIDNLGRDLTNVSIFSVNGTTITGNTYEITTVGTFNITATYDGIDGDTETVVSATPTHTTKVLVEDYTGTWCGWCWYMAESIDDALVASDDVVPVAIHNGDPMVYANESALASEFGVSGYPAGRINRIHEWNQSSQGNGIYYTFNQLQNYLDIPVGLGLGIDSNISGSSVNVSVKVGYDITYSNNLKLVVYLLEDNLVYTGSAQYKYYTDSTPTESFSNFIHKHVLWLSFTDDFGDIIPSSDTEAGDIYTVNLSKIIPDEVVDNNNLSIVAFVVNEDTNEVINVQKANIGVNQDFD